MVPSTPGSVLLQRNSNALTVTCDKAGYASAAQVVPSNFNGVTFGNLLLGGIVGIVVDATSGANNSYPDEVMVNLAAPSLPPIASVQTPYVPGAPIRLQP